MVRILIFGVFDLLHEGHKFFIRKSREHGDYLIASVARDSYVKKYKDRTPVHNQEERMKGLKDTGLVDEAVLSDESIGSFEIIRKMNPDCICIGYDQHSLHKKLSDWIVENKRDISIAVIPPFREDTFKTSHLLKDSG